MNRNVFLAGIQRGLPVAMGYFSVSLGFGALAANQGIGILQTSVFSLTNFTSAGQFAGVTLMVGGAGLWEVILTQMVINSRYALMALALSQRLGDRANFFQRLLIAFFNSDEIFGIAMGERLPLTPSFMLGLGILPLMGWVAGSFVGALAGSLLPPALSAAMGVMLYGMFIAILSPPALKERPVCIAVILSAILSGIFAWVPGVKEISSGLAIVICTVVVSAVCAALFPVSEEEEAA